MDLPLATTTSRSLLAAQFLLGAQARLLPHLTPSISAIPYSHAQGFRSSLPFIPSSDAAQHTRIIGFLLAAGGWSLALPLVLPFASRRRGMDASSSSSSHSSRSTGSTGSTGWMDLVKGVGNTFAVLLPAGFVYVHWRLGLGLGLPVFNLCLGGMVLLDAVLQR